VPLDSDGNYSGNVLDLFNVYTVLAGLATVALFALHGATFLTLRTTGDLCARAAAVARRLSVPVAILLGALLAWTVAVGVGRNDKDVFPPVLPAALGVAALVLTVVFARSGRSGWSFVSTAVAAALWVATIFTTLYPRVLVSHPSFSNSLTMSGAAAGHYALSVITVVAAVLTPVVLLYQGWSYHVFRARLGGEPPAIAAVEPLQGRPAGTPTS
jgi:cytochrome d ubiquinol oxidase subunit II